MASTLFWPTIGVLQVSFLVVPLHRVRRRQCLRFQTRTCPLPPHPHCHHHGHACACPRQVPRRHCRIATTVPASWIRGLISSCPISAMTGSDQLASSKVATRPPFCGKIVVYLESLSALDKKGNHLDSKRRTSVGKHLVGTVTRSVETARRAVRLCAQTETIQRVQVHPMSLD